MTLLLFYTIGFGIVGLLNCILILNSDKKINSLIPIITTIFWPITLLIILLSPKNEHSKRN